MESLHQDLSSMEEKLNGDIPRDPRKGNFSRLSSISTNADDEVDDVGDEEFDEGWQDEFQQSGSPNGGETLIILDFDDTLFPTSHVYDDAGLRWDKAAACFARKDEGVAETRGVTSEALERREQTIAATRERLREHTKAIAELLRTAVGLGQVCIVTLAVAGWVEMLIDMFMPDLEPVLEELDIKVVYARATLSPQFAGKVERKGCELGEALKSFAMRKIFADRYECGSKRLGNVLSIGDSTAEYYAIQDVVMSLSDCLEEKCRCKALRLLEAPSLELLTMEVQLLTSWIFEFVARDEDLNVDFETLLQGT